MQFFKKTLLVFSDFDSRLKWGLSIAQYLEDDFEQIIVYHKEKNLQPYEEYVKSNYVIKKYSKSADIFQEIEFLKTIHVVVLAMGGTENIYFLNKMKQYYDMYGVRPMVISGMNGLTDCNDLHALLCRVGADIICVNSYNNFISFKEKMLALSVDSDSLLLFGYARIYGNNIQKKDCRNINTSLIIGQANIPAQRRQQMYFVDKICEYAIKYPDRKIIIKQRNITHRQHMNAYFERYKMFQPWRWRAITSFKMPPNVIYSDEPIEKLFMQADLCLGFYSTALIEAIHLGIPTIVINDFGVGKNVGNHDFVESGLLASMDDWINDRIPKVNWKWKKENCNFATMDEICKLKKIIYDKLFKGIGGMNEQYYSINRFPYFYYKVANAAIVKKVFNSLFKFFMK